MTARATFTQAELARAIAAATREGKVVVWTALGIAFVQPDQIGLPLAVESAGDNNSCDEVFNGGRSCG